MTVKFDWWSPRQHVAAMLEAPTRLFFQPLGRAEAEARNADVLAILGELDRIDRVNDAKTALRVAEYAWRQSIIEQYAKVTDSPVGQTCAGRSSYGYRRVERNDHKAKYRLQGMDYCGTHLKRAQESAERSAVSVHRHEHVEDPALIAIIDADRELIEQRRKAGL